MPEATLAPTEPTAAAVDDVLSGGLPTTPPRDRVEAPERPVARLAAAVAQPLAAAVNQLAEEVAEPLLDAVRGVAEALGAGPEEVAPPPTPAPRGDEPERAAPQEPSRAESRPATANTTQAVASPEAARPAERSGEAPTHDQERRDERPSVAAVAARQVTAGGEAAAVFSLPEATGPTETTGRTVPVADPQELRQLVVRHARLMRTPSTDEFVVEVRHPEAGTVTVRVVRDAEAVHVALQTGHEGLRREMQAQLPELQTALREHGLQLGSFDLSSRQQPEYQRHLTQQPQPRSGGLLPAPPEREPQAESAPRPATGGGLAVWA